MRKTVLVVVAALGCHSSRAPEPIVLEHVELTRVADGVYAAIRKDEPLGLAQNANSLFIINADGVLVVDAQFTREATLENMRALRQLTKKPVLYVVNTHWHDDHVAGNQVYQDSFPNARFIAHPNTREDLITLGRPNREGQVRFGPQALARFQRLAGMGLGIDSTPASPAEAAAMRNAGRIFSQYLAESPGFREVLPNSTVEHSSVLTSGARRVELHWYGRGATRGDLVVWLPNERVLATGDLVVWPMPFAFGSHPAEWVSTLDSLVALQPLVLIPGHGPVMRDLSYVATERRMLDAATARAAAAVARGDTSAPVFARTERMDDIRAEVAGQDKWKNLMFDQFFRVGALTGALSDAMSSRTQ
jgi:glyoxylase-like metal-dependent hydrolase (beta-lactamase superfamily II)